MSPGAEAGGGAAPAAAPGAGRPGWLRAGGIPLFLAALLSAAAVDHPNPGWGVNTRLALVFAVVDEGRFAIDSYHATPPTATGDKAEFGGHFYSDKIFGVSLLALPVYAGMRALGLAPDFRTANWVLRVFAVSLPAALSLVLLWSLLVRGGAEPRLALLAVALCFWGSLWFGFSTAFFPYAPGLAFALLALHWTLFPPASPLSAGRAAVIGLAAGYAILCDMIFGLLVLALAAVCLLRVADEAGWLPGVGPWPAGNRRGRPGATLRVLGAGAVAGVVPFGLFAAYTWSIFGTPTIPYRYEHLPVFLEGMREGFMGITWPRLGPLWFLTLHPYRGLFFWSPVLLLAVAGLVGALRTPGLRRLYGALGLSTLLAYLAFNSGYYMWWGGYAMGPRLLLPVFATLPLGFVHACRRGAPRAGVAALLALGAVSVALSLPLSLLEPEIPFVHDYRLLRVVTPATNLGVPQFDYWRHFFSAAAWWNAAGLRTGRVLSFGAAVAIPLLLLAWGLRRLRPGGAALSPPPGRAAPGPGA